MSVSPSRRRLLQAALVCPVLAACTDEPAQPARIDPDVALRAAAVARERALVDAYRAAAGSSSSAVAARTAGLAEEHEQHLAALRAPSPSASTSSAPAAVPTLTQLLVAERAAAGAHAAAAVRASRDLATVLASLAASEASHAVVLT
ncbi:MAG: hypothetical protein QOJ79_1323 [Actinomycetota bacterium]|jgi:hypothetical protein|nr:hypothetical protein [Actinomycetota bacterium]